MSRLRVVKPEFWCSEQVVSCTRDARLLFIGIWNFSDDHGIKLASYLRLKMEVFPGDDCTIVDIQRWIGELIHCGLLREYVVDDKTYWIVTGWHHQKIDKPTYRHPLPHSEMKRIEDNSASPHREFDDNSTTTQRMVDESSVTESSLVESSLIKDIVVSETDSHCSIDASTQRNCPHEDIIKLYHEILPMCPPVRRWTDARRKLLKGRWAEDKKHQNLDWWRGYFEHVKKSKFLTGQASGRDDRPPFLASLEWLVRPANLTKVIEGFYHKGAISNE